MLCYKFDTIEEAEQANIEILEQIKQLDPTVVAEKYSDIIITNDSFLLVKIEQYNLTVNYPVIEYTPEIL
jgi:hypothetical protein